MRQPKLTHEKYIAPIVAKQNPLYKPKKCMHKRASVFLHKGVKIHTLKIELSLFRFCLALINISHFLIFLQLFLKR